MNRFNYQFLRIEKKINRNGLLYLWTMRMMPGSPFVIVNMFMGMTNIKATHFFIVTFFGMLPGNSIFVYAGHRLLEIGSVWEILNPEMILLLLFFALMPVLVRHLYGRSLAP